MGAWALSIRLLGGFDLRQGDAAMPALESARAESLLAYLLLHREAPQPRQRVAFLLWPDSTESQARTNLRHVLHNLRRALPDVDRFVDVTARTLQWRPDAPCWLDVSAFEAALAAVPDGQEHRVAALRRAVDAYTGDLLTGRDDDWILERRERLRRRYLDALGELVVRLEEGGDLSGALRYAERLRREEPLREETYRLLIGLHDVRGDRARALRVYYECAATLQRELGVEPGAATRRAYDALLPREREPEADPLGDAPLVGRSAERARLTTLWRAARGGPAQLALVIGEAGVGKTRLGRLAREQLTEVGRLLPEVYAETPGLARPPTLRDPEQRQRLFDTIAQALLRAQTPLLLVVDDIQWCDRETLQLLHYLIRQDSRTPLLVVATVRREDAEFAQPLTDVMTALRPADRLTEIELGRLGREETALLAERLAGHRLTETEVDALQAQTEGNPLFVIEAMRAGWRPGAGWLTPKVQAAVESRLGQLSERARDLVGVAATIGREFTARVLGRTSGADDDTLVRGLDELWRRRIIREQGADAYDFSHDKIREVAYLALSPARRRHYHLRIAQALEELHAEDPGRVSGQLAGHYESAGAAEPAIGCYQRAAEVAQQMNAQNEAVRLLDRALGLLPELPDGTERRTRELGLSTTLLSPLAMAEGYGSTRLVAVQHTVVELSRLLGLEPAPELLRSVALARLSTGDFAAAQQCGEQLLVGGRRRGDDVLVVEGEYVLGISAFWQADFEAARGHFEAAAAHYRPEHRDTHLVRYGTDPKVVCLSRLANTLWFLGRTEEAGQARDAAFARAEEIDHPNSLGTALVFGALLALDMGERDRFRGYAADLDADRDRQAAPNRLAAEAFGGLVDVLDGRVESGLARIREAQDAASSGAYAPGMAGALARVLLEAAAATGDAAQVVAAADRLLAMGGGAQVWAGVARRLRAESLAVVG